MSNVSHLKFSLYRARTHEELLHQAIGIVSKLKPGPSKIRHASRVFKRLHAVRSNIRKIEEVWLPIC